MQRIKFGDDDFSLEDSYISVVNKETQTDATESFTINYDSVSRSLQDIITSENSIKVLEYCKLFANEASDNTIVIKDVYGQGPFKVSKDTPHSSLSSSRQAYCKEVLIPYLNKTPPDCAIDGSVVKELLQDTTEEYPDYQPCVAKNDDKIIMKDKDQKGSECELKKKSSKCCLKEKKPCCKTESTSSLGKGLKDCVSKVVAAVCPGKSPSKESKVESASIDEKSSKDSKSEAPKKKEPGGIRRSISKLLCTPCPCPPPTENPPCPPVSCKSSLPTLGQSVSSVCEGFTGCLSKIIFKDKDSECKSKNELDSKDHLPPCKVKSQTCLEEESDPDLPDCPPKEPPPCPPEEPPPCPPEEPPPCPFDEPPPCPLEEPPPCPPKEPPPCPPKEPPPCPPKEPPPCPPKEKKPCPPKDPPPCPPKDPPPCPPKEKKPCPPKKKSPCPSSESAHPCPPKEPVIGIKTSPCEGDKPVYFLTDKSKTCKPCPPREPPKSKCDKVSFDNKSKLNIITLVNDMEQHNEVLSRIDKVTDIDIASTEVVNIADDKSTSVLKENSLLEMNDTETNKETINNFMDNVGVTIKPIEEMQTVSNNIAIDDKIDTVSDDTEAVGKKSRDSLILVKNIAHLIRHTASVSNASVEASTDVSKRDGNSETGSTRNIETRLRSSSSIIPSFVTKIVGAVDSTICSLKERMDLDKFGHKVKEHVTETESVRSPPKEVSHNVESGAGVSLTQSMFTSIKSKIFAIFGDSEGTAEEPNDSAGPASHKSSRVTLVSQDKEDDIMNRLIE